MNSAEGEGVKLLGIMSLKERRPEVRELLKRHDVQIYSETDILGHTTETIAEFAAAGDSDHPIRAFLVPVERMV